VGSETPTISAISVPEQPSAANNTILARFAERAGMVCDRTRRSNSARSESDSDSIFLRIAIAQYCINPYIAQGTSATVY
jgi:hypothetical protein